jgi:hypothetical protein
MSDADIFSARAAEARRDADGATLDNVRERCLRSAEAWEGMAARAARSVQFRAEAAEKKAAQVSEAAAYDEEIGSLA